MNWIFAMLHNTATGRYHPILFYENPLPSSDGTEKCVRHKSKGHHTAGFDTRPDALAFIESTKANYPGCRMCLEKDFPWDGDDMPAMVVFFVEHEGQMIPAF